MFRATTPTHTFDIGTDAASLSKILLTYQQGGETILEKDKTELTCDGTVISYKLTQEETKLFKANRTVSVQIRFMTAEGTVIASDIMAIPVNRVLNDEVL